MSASPDRSTPQKIAIVTGGSRGIGRNTVLSLARRGVSTILTFNQNQADAASAVAAAEELGARSLALHLDTGNIGSFPAFVEEVRSALQTLGADRFDFLVNNAGNNHRNLPFEKTTEAELDSLYTVHFKGVFLLTQQLLPLLRDGGSIVNISSGRTRFTIPGGSAYASLKAAVEVLTRHMAKELGPRGITVNVVAPGAVATDFSGGVVRDNPELNRHIAELTALGRVGQPEDLGPAISSLLSPDSRWITGQRIEVSGGQAL